jgi:hypothetical protein
MCLMFGVRQITLRCLGRQLRMSHLGSALGVRSATTPDPREQRQHQQLRAALDPTEVFQYRQGRPEGEQ